MNEAPLFAGVARVDISPPPGVPHAGWGAQLHEVARGIDMPLYATALVLAQQQTRVAILDIDLIGFNSEQVGLIHTVISERTGFAKEQIRLCTTHNHSGPNYFRATLASRGLEDLRSYLGNLPDTLAAAVAQAAASMQVVRTTWGTGSCPISVNRRAPDSTGRLVVGRNPEGPVDHTVRVIRVEALDGSTFATIVHFSCHPTTVGWQNELVTPDYPGVVRLEVERLLGGTCLFLQGAAGNVGPIVGPTGDLSLYRRLGRCLGLEASSVALRSSIPRAGELQRVVESGAPLAVYGDVLADHTPRLAVRSRTVRLPVKHFDDPGHLRRDSDELKNALEALREYGSSDDVQLARAQATQANARAELAELYSGTREIEWQVHAIAIGESVLVGVPGEPFVEIGMRVAADSPFLNTLFSGYTNGGFGYLPTAGAHAEGGYEVDASPFAAEAGEVLIKQVRILLDEIAEEAHPAGTSVARMVS